MRILIIHNYYGSSAPSGENKVFELERRMLESRGHTVGVYVRHSDQIRAQGMWGVLKGAMSTIWNPWMLYEIGKKISLFDPDIVHVHNTFPLLSPAIFWANRGRAKIVMTLHNYRMVCPNAIPMRNEKICTLCIDQHNVWSALRFGCYRESRLATLPLALSVVLHRILGTWRYRVDAFITLSDFQRRKMIDAGFSADKVLVKPHSYKGGSKGKVWCERESAIIFVGRLSPEKGVATLIQAWRLWGEDAPELRLIGDGPLRHTLVKTAEGLPVRFLGQMSEEDTQKEIAKVKMLVLPSEWYETFGMVVIEAFAHGTAVAVSEIGALPSIVDDGRTGILFPPADPRRLYEKISKCWMDDMKLCQMGIAARMEFEEKYTEEANYRRLMAIYDQTMKEQKESKRC